MFRFRHVSFFAATHDLATSLYVRCVVKETGHEAVVYIMAGT